MVATNERHGLWLRENLGNGPLSRIGEFGAAQIVGTVSQKPLSYKGGKVCCNNTTTHLCHFAISSSISATTPPDSQPQTLSSPDRIQI